MVPTLKTRQTYYFSILITATKLKGQGSLLYGRNGAGKSTLAKAVKSAKGEVQEAIIQADFWIQTILHLN